MQRFRLRAFAPLVALLAVFGMMSACSSPEQGRDGTSSGGANGSGASNGNGTGATAIGGSDGTGASTSEEECCTSYIDLPVEVLGGEGTTDERTFDVDESVASSASRLWLQVNNLGYENKASVQINDEPWLALNHDTVKMNGTELARGGMVHGGFNTIRFSIPADGIMPGSNTVRFRFDLSDSISIGFRVVKMDLLDEDGTHLLDPRMFVEEDPRDWQAPDPSPEAIAKGKALWYGADLWSHYLPDDREGFWYTQVLGPRRPIRAQCADCHAQDGRDLEIFSYSNLSIIERSKFHGLSEEEGIQIASYIRSLSETHENVGRYGRPWNPPYQPGPEIADRPIEMWAAGAGLDAVLEKDADMLPYMFPDGVTEESVNTYFDSDQMWDRTTQPLAVQFPDWKHWLPLVHPMDAYDADGFYDEEELQFSPKRGYEELRAFLESGTALDDGDVLLQEISDFWWHYRGFLTQGGTWEHWRTKDGDALTRGLRSDVPKELAATSLARHLAVKYFEIFNEFDLQDKAPQVAEAADQPAERQWLGDAYQVFEVPPHFQACVDGTCDNFVGQPRATGHYESTAWYHLQLVINGGNGMVSGNSPVDYNYHPGFILSASFNSGIAEPLRYYHSNNAMYQTRTWSGGNNPNDGKGMRLRVMGPWLDYGLNDSFQSGGYPRGVWPTYLDDLKPGLMRWIINARLRQFIKEVNRPHNSLDLWERYEDGDDWSNRLDPVSQTEEEMNPDPMGVSDWADKIYYVLPRYAQMGVDCEVLSDLVAWTQAAWPNVNWAQFLEQARAAVVLDLQGEPGAYSKMVAVPANGGSSPKYSWTINGDPIDFVGPDLPSSEFSEGDVIGVQLSSDSTCVPEAQRTAEAQRWVIPPPGDPSVLEPVSWLDAMDVALGEEPADGDRVSTWFDRSGNGYSWASPDASHEPTYSSSGFNGLPALLFAADGDGDKLVIGGDGASPFEGDAWTTILVGRVDQSSWSDTIGNKSSVSGDGWFARFAGDGRLAIANGNVTGVGGSNPGLPRTFVASIAYESGELSVYLDGTHEVSGATAEGEAITNGVAVSLGQSDNGGRYHDGPLAEVLTFNRELLPEQRAYIEAYLAEKWGL